MPSPRTVAEEAAAARFDFATPEPWLVHAADCPPLEAAAALAARKYHGMTVELENVYGVPAAWWAGAAEILAEPGPAPAPEPGRPEPDPLGDDAGADADAGPPAPLAERQKELREHNLAMFERVLSTAPAGFWLDPSRWRDALAEAVYAGAPRAVAALVEAARREIDAAGVGREFLLAGVLPAASIPDGPLASASQRTHGAAGVTADMAAAARREARRLYGEVQKEMKMETA